MDAQTLSEQATLKRFDASQDRVARDFGYGDTKGALGITQDCLGSLSLFIQGKRDDLEEGPQYQSKELSFLRVVKALPSSVIALAILNGALHAVAGDGRAITARQMIGQALNGECWAAQLRAHDEALAARIETAVRRKHGRLKYRQQAARSIAVRAGFEGKPWERKEVFEHGAIALAWLLEALPHVFTREIRNEDVKDRVENLSITEGALAVAERAVEECLRASPMFFPMTEAPKPWVSWYDGGYWDERSRLRAPVVRTHHKETAGAIRAAIRDGSMKPHLDALNALQAVPWAINGKVLEVVKWAYDADIGVEGLPPKSNVPLPLKPAAWDDMDADARRIWKYRVGQIKEHNRANVSNRVLLKQDIETATMMMEAGRFWTPLNCDWRGRVYAVPHFNFQRDDRVRGLFLFADGQPIGEEGLYWLKVHVANCGDFDKISKRPLEERAAWVDANLDFVKATYGSPTVDLRWLKADKPFLFLAACLELTSAMAEGSHFITRLPVSFDGSCSGLQHLCAMTRAPEGALVNLTPSQAPKDIYQAVANLVTTQLETASAGGNDLAKTCLAQGITRNIVKRNVMTYSYSSKKFGMAQQLNEDLMRPLAFTVLSGKSTSHPFGDEDGRPAAKYLAGLIYEAIETLVHRPAQAMTMLQKCARALAHEGKPVSWTTPLGLPWVNRYHLPNMHKVDLWLHDTRVQMTYTNGYQKEIDKDKAANGVAPNFVHACDAAHLLMVANASAREDITQVATVHDSFGCLAPQAARFRQIIREQFVELYENNDVLAQVLAQCKHDLTIHNQQRLPELPVYGPLNLKEVLNAEFAFA